MPERERYSLEEAQSEAEILQKKVQTGEALSLEEAEQQLAGDQKYYQAMDEKIAASPEVQNTILVFEKFCQDALANRHVFQQSDIAPQVLDGYDHIMLYCSPEYLLKRSTELNDLIMRSVGQTLTNIEGGSRFVSGGVLGNLIDSEGIEAPPSDWGDSLDPIYLDDFEENEEYRNNPYLQRYFQVAKRLADIYKENQDSHDLTGVIRKEFPVLFEEGIRQSKNMREEMLALDAKELIADLQHRASHVVKNESFAWSAWLGDTPQELLAKQQLSELNRNFNKLILGID